MAHAPLTWNAALANVAYTPGHADAPTIPFTGFGEDTLISLEPIGDAFENSEGADGLMDRTNRNARSYTLTVSLKQVSPTNTALHEALRLEQDDVDGNIGKISIAGLDGSKKAAGSAWIVTPPKEDYARKMSMREWKFTVTEVDFN